MPEALLKKNMVYAALPMANSIATQSPVLLYIQTLKINMATARSNPTIRPIFGIHTIPARDNPDSV